ncbi:MAG: GspH/FimT family pseudopilin [Gallionella sp.]|nr:GspH/FimT family pseudopilin [Gallionella sp.]
MKNRTAAGRGFTLIELMVTVAMVAIMMALAVPSITTFMRNAELTSFTNTLLAAINAARSEAMKRGRHAMVVPNDGSDWNSGWVVFVDVDHDGTHSTGDIDILISATVPGYLTVSNLGNTSAANLYVMYDASGFSKLKTGAFGAWTFAIRRNDVSGSDLLTQTRRIKIASTGRARVCTPKTSTDIDCKATLVDQ